MVAVLTLLWVKILNFFSFDKELIEKVEKLVSSNQILRRQIQNLKNQTSNKSYKQPNQKPFDFSR